MTQLYNRGSYRYQLMKKQNTFVYNYAHFYTLDNTGFFEVSWEVGSQYSYFCYDKEYYFLNVRELS